MASTHFQQAALHAGCCSGTYRLSEKSHLSYTKLLKGGDIGDSIEECYRDY